MKREKPELLAPAGNFEKMQFAFHYGADAVYIGGQDFSLRANAENFSLTEIKKAVKYAHKLNKKVYVTVNIIFHNEDIKNIENYLYELEKAKVDAVIISDPFLIDIIKNKTPNLEMHLSTQQSALNYETCKFFANENIKRIVLARETSKHDIKKIIKNGNIDVEMFIHGAMCVSFSGRCVLSNYFTNRDSNRGGCSQICRWNFDLYNEKKEKIENKTNFSIAVKDLSNAINIKEIIDLKVKSLKIEGRMRSIYYIANVINIYRKIIDNAFENKNYEYDKFDEYELFRCANREAVSQYFNSKPTNKEQYYLQREEQSNKDFLGIVLDYKNSEIILEQRNFFKVGDNITIFGPNQRKIVLNVEYIKDTHDNLLDAARHPKQVVKIPCKTKVYKNDLLRVFYTIDNNSKK